jgi:DNA polymerase-3 subunit beta
VDGEYIDYAKSLPKDFRTTVDLDLSDTVSCFERCALVIDERAKSPIRLTVLPDAIQVKCVTSNGKVDEEILCDVKGEEMLIGFNNKFLLDAMRAALSCGAEKIRLELTSPFSGMAITSPENDSFYYMVVPLKLN